MKKRILSLLLAVMMVVTVLVIPASAEVTNDYSYTFKDQDVRNQIEGQVLDLGAKGESSVAIEVDGVIDDAYGAAYDAQKYKETASGPDGVKMYFAVRGSVLYGAIDSGVDERYQFRINPGVATGHTGTFRNKVYLRAYTSDDYMLAEGHESYQAIDTAKTKITADLKYEGADYIKDFAYAAGVYEFALDLSTLYAETEGIVGSFWDCPTLNFTFVFETSEGTSLTESVVYGFRPNQCKDANASGNLVLGSVTIWNSSASEYMPWTIILPKSTLTQLAAGNMGLPELGTDWRNAVPGQLAAISHYASVDPAMDGVVSPFEYTTTHDWGNGITAHYSVKDGYFYVATEYELAANKNPVLYIGLAENIGGNHVNSSFVLSWAGTPGVPSSGVFYTAARPESMDTLESISNVYGALVTTASHNNPASAGKVTSSANNNGIRVNEAKIFIPDLIAAFERLGFDASKANYIQINVSTTGATNRTGITKFEVSEELAAALNENSEYDVVSDYVNPTVALPKGCTDLYRVTNFYDLEGFGQGHTGAAIATTTPTVDGLLDDLYKYSVDHTYLETGKTLSGKDYYAQDDEYIYICTVYELHNNTNYNDFYIAPVVDGKGDILKGSHGLQVRVKSSGVDSANTKLIFSSQETLNTGTFAGTTNQTNMTTRLTECMANANFIKGARNWSSTNKRAGFELKVNKKMLSYIFFGGDSIEAAPDFDKLSHYNVYTGAGSVGVVNTNIQFDRDSTDLGMLLLNLTKADYKAAHSSMSYVKSDATVKAGNIVHLDVFDVKDGASVRGADSYNRTGLRFKTLYLESYIESMKALATSRGETLEIGTIIAPANYVENAGEFTMEALEAEYGDRGYIKVVATVDSPFADADANGIVTYAGSIVNIKEGNRDREFAGIGYIKIGDDVWYSESYCVRDASSVAKAATEDTKTESDGNLYVNAVTNLAGETVYTKYSVVAYNNFKSLVVAE